MAERAVKYTADKTSWSKLPQPPRPCAPLSDNFGHLAPGPLQASIVEPSHAGDPFPYYLALPPPMPSQPLRWTAERAAQLPVNATSQPWSDSSCWPRPCSPSTGSLRCLEDRQEGEDDVDNSGWLAWAL